MQIEIDKLSHCYGQGSPFEYLALEDVDLTIQQGKFVAIVGHTGSGKSTLIQHFNGLLKPTGGQLRVNDFLVLPNVKLKNSKQLKKTAGLVFQFPEYQLFEDTILKDVMFGPKNFDNDETKAMEKAKTALLKVGMKEEYFENSPFELSGGQKRRVAIAGILAMEPDILVLDEPTAGLDPQGSYEMMEMFKKINQDEQKTIILVTHEMNHVLDYCDEVILMDEGKVIKHVTTDEFFKETELLFEHSIKLPLITEFIHELNQLDYQIDPSIKTIDELVMSLKEQVHVE